MSTEQTQTELIEYYLSGKMSAEESAAFENKLKRDAFLAEETALQREVLGGIERVALKAQIKNAFKTEQKRIRKLKWMGATGALVSATLVALFFVVPHFLENKTKDTASRTRIKTKVQAPEQTQLLEKAELKNQDSIAPRYSESKVLVKKKSEKPVKAASTESFVLPPAFLPKKLQFSIHPLRDTTLAINAKGTVLHIKANSFKDKNGKLVKSPVNISWREYTNAAEMAFSKIPMTYKEKGEEYNFNSAGMFEIYGETNGEPVEVVKERPMIIDYALAKQIPDINFYKLDEQKKEWEKKRDLFTSGNGSFLSYTTGIVGWENAFAAGKLDYIMVEEGFAYEAPFNRFPANKQDSLVLEKSYGRNWSALIKEIKLKDTLVPLYEKVGDTETREQRRKLVIVKGGQRSAKFVKDFIRKDNGFHQTVDNAFYSAKKDNAKLTAEDSVKTIQNAQRQFFGMIQNSSMQYYDGMLWGRDYRYNAKEVLVDSFKYEKNKRYLISTRSIPIDEEYSLTREKTIEAQQSYSKIIQGLSIAGFGVYNCDQINRIKSPATIFPVFQNEKGEQISKTYAVTLIDMDYNAAFSFGSTYFVCSQAGKNNLLVFTLNNEIFIYDPSDFKTSNITSSGSYTLKMKEITNEVKNTEDLKTYLGLKN